MRGGRVGGGDLILWGEGKILRNFCFSHGCTETENSASSLWGDPSDQRGLGGRGALRRVRDGYRDSSDTADLKILQHTALKKKLGSKRERGTVPSWKNRNPRSGHRRDTPSVEEENRESSPEKKKNERKEDETSAFSQKDILRNRHSTLRQETRLRSGFTERGSGSKESL